MFILHLSKTGSWKFERAADGMRWSVFFVLSHVATQCGWSARSIARIGFSTSQNFVRIQRSCASRKRHAHPGNDCPSFLCCRFTISKEKRRVERRTCGQPFCCSSSVMNCARDNDGQAVNNKREIRETKEKKLCTELTCIWKSFPVLSVSTCIQCWPTL